jgi:hypothetical protein
LVHSLITTHTGSCCKGRIATKVTEKQETNYGNLTIRRARREYNRENGKKEVESQKEGQEE